MADRYLKLQIKTTDEGRRYRSNPIYPEIPENENDTYLIATGADRYDSLAQTYYGDSSLWWIISSANSTNDRSSLIPSPGTQIRIPYNKEDAISLFNNLNRTR